MTHKPTGPTPDRITLTRSDLAVLLAHHADVFAASLHAYASTGLPGYRDGLNRAAELLTLHANRLTAEEEHPAVAELLDSMLTCPIEQPAPEDRAALRDRIAARLDDAFESFDPAQTEDAQLSGHLADAVLAELPEPTGQTTDRGAVLREAAVFVEAMNEGCGIPVCPSCDTREDVAAELRRLADEAQPTTEIDEDTRAADPLAGSATEYRVLVPEDGGTNLIVRRQGITFGAGWSVAVPGWGGGRAWTAEGWQESISALSVDRLFCWSDAETAVTEARRALAAGARQDGAQQQEADRD